MADADQAVIRRWGLFNAEDPKGRAIPYPATYLVDTSGRVAWRHVGQSTRDRPAPENILDFLKGQARSAAG